MPQTKLTPKMTHWEILIKTNNMLWTPGRALCQPVLFLTLVALVHGGLDPTILLNDGTYFPFVSLGGG